MADPISTQLKSVMAPDGGPLRYRYDGFLTTNSTQTGTVSDSVDRVRIRMAGRIWIRGIGFASGGSRQMDWIG